jgi:hypothetical protein
MRRIDTDDNLDNIWERANRVPTALDVADWGNVWERVHQNDRMNNIPASDLDAFNDPLRTGDAHWLMAALQAMEVDILHRYLNVGPHTRDEKEILLMLRVGRSLLRFYMDLDERYEAEGWRRFLEEMGIMSMGYENVDTYLKSVDLSSLDENSRVCSICMEPFGSTGPPEDPCKVSCVPGHIFGSDCIRKWLATKRTCPMCREELMPQDSEPVGYMSVGTPWWLKVMRGD